MGDDYGRIAHEAYEKAAAESGWETNPASRVPWEDVPPENQAATRAAANAVANVVRGEEDRFRIGMEFGRSTERAVIIQFLQSLTTFREAVDGTYIRLVPPVVIDAIENGEYLEADGG